MDWFDEDPFEDLVREFLGNKKTRYRNIESEKENREIDFLETEDKVFFIFEMPGYDEKDLLMEIKDRTIKIEVSKKQGCKMQEYLSKKLCKGEVIRKTIPSGIDTKNFDHSFVNGILEMRFNKK